MAQQSILFEVSLRTMVRLMLVLGAILFVFFIREILILVMLSIILASGIDPIATVLERRGFPRLFGVLLVYLIAFGSLATLLWILVPPLLHDVSDFYVVFPDYFRVIGREFERFGFFSEEIFLNNMQQLLTEVTGVIGSLTGSLTQVLFDVFGGIVSALSVFLISVYLALQRDGVERFLRLLAPSAEEPYVIDLWHRAEKKIGYWVRGQFILSFIVGMVSWIGLSFMGVHYALLLALIATVLEVVPMVGPIAAGIIAVSVALFQEPLLGVAVAAFYLAVQQIEGHVLVPLVFRRVLGLHPVVIIVSLMIGAKLGGSIGLILAVPVTAILMEFLNDWAQGKVKI